MALSEVCVMATTTLTFLFFSPPTHNHHMTKRRVVSFFGAVMFRNVGCRSPATAFGFRGLPTTHTSVTGFAALFQTEKMGGPPCKNWQWHVLAFRKSVPPHPLPSDPVHRSGRWRPHNTFRKCKKRSPPPWNLRIAHFNIEEPPPPSRDHVSTHGAVENMFRNLKKGEARLWSLYAGL